MPALTADMVKAQALSLGFDLCGICRPESYPELGFLAEWLKRGYAGDMAYLGRTRRVRSDVRHILPSTQSVIVTATAEDGTARGFTTNVRIDTPEEYTAFSHGGILPYVARQLARRA